MATIANTTHSGEVVGYLEGLLAGTPDQPSTVYTTKSLLSNDEFSITVYQRNDNRVNNPLTKYSVVYITFKTEHFEPEQYKQCLSTFAQLLQILDHRYYMVVDTFQMTMQDKPKLLGMVKAFTDVNRAMLPYHKERLLCTVVVISSSFVKTFINSVLGMFYKPLRPLMFITDLSEFTRFITDTVAIDHEIYQGMHDSGQVQL